MKDSFHLRNRLYYTGWIITAPFQPWRRVNNVSPPIAQHSLLGVLVLESTWKQKTYLQLCARPTHSHSHFTWKKHRGKSRVLISSSQYAFQSAPGLQRLYGASPGSPRSPLFFHDKRCDSSSIHRIFPFPTFYSILPQ